MTALFRMLNNPDTAWQIVVHFSLDSAFGLLVQALARSYFERRKDARLAKIQQEQDNLAHDQQKIREAFAGLTGQTINGVRYRSIGELK